MKQGAIAPGARPAETATLTWARARELAGLYLELTKPRITLMVLVTCAAGFVLAQGDLRWGAADLALLFHALAGTGLAASSASALNQVMEREHDARMRRTAGRPLPSGKLEPLPAAIFGIALGVVSVVWLAAAVNLLTAVLAAITTASYVLIYTPLKRVSSLSTVIGAAPGAMPPVMGWAASTDMLGAGAWALFGILFFWQLPHFLAIAWMYRADYERGGFLMLPVIEPDGRSTARQSVIWAAALIPLSLVPTALGLVGPVYATGALVLGLGYLAASISFGRRRTGPAGRTLLIASILYLPGILGAMTADRLIHLVF